MGNAYSKAAERRRRGDVFPLALARRAPQVSVLGGSPKSYGDVLSRVLPLMMGSMGAEMLASWVLGRGLYRANDTISSLSCGLVSRLLQGYLRLLTVLPYQALHNAIALRRVRVDTWPKMALALVLVDLGYYVHHRAAHSMNLAWGGHKTHHSSEEFNLSTALRQGLFEGAFAWVWYLPLALFFDYRVYRTWMEVNMVWQFWVHTRLVHRCPAWMEAVLVTPSHHRVHHAANPEYLDKNYGGVFILWDRLFGTFAAETTAPVYGLTIPLQSLNPLWATVHHFAGVARRLRRFPREGWLAKLQVLYKGPGWSPKMGKYYPAPRVDARTFERYDPPASGATKGYAVLQFTATLAASTLLLGGVNKRAAAAVLARVPGGKSGAVAMLLFSLFAHSRLLDVNVQQRHPAVTAATAAAGGDGARPKTSLQAHVAAWSALDAASRARRAWWMEALRLGGLAWVAHRAVGLGRARRPGVAAWTQRWTAFYMGLSAAWLLLLRSRLRVDTRGAAADGAGSEAGAAPGVDGARRDDAEAPRTPSRRPREATAASSASSASPGGRHQRGARREGHVSSTSFAGGPSTPMTPSSESADSGSSSSSSGGGSEGGADDARDGRGAHGPEGGAGGSQERWRQRRLMWNERLSAATPPAAARPAPPSRVTLV